MRYLKEFCLTVADHVTAVAIITPLVVAFWWGTWTLLDVYLFPEDIIKRSLTTAAIGHFGMTLLYRLQDLMAKIDSRAKDSTSVGWFFFNNLYISIFAVLNVCSWHGVWTSAVIAIEKAQLVHDDQVMWIGILLAVILVGFIMSRTLKNTIAPPIVCCIDTDPELYKCVTRFQQSSSKGGIAFLLDCCFTQVLIHSLVPLYWMASWTIWDIHLAPLSFLENFIACISVGTALTLIVYMLQIPVSQLCKKLEAGEEKWLWKTMLEQVFYGTGSVAAVASWRGWWMLYTGYLQIGSYTVAGPWIGAVGGLFLLMRILSGSSVICKGGLIDGEYEKGQGGILNTHYFRYFISKSQNNEDTEDLGLSVESINMPV